MQVSQAVFTCLKRYARSTTFVLSVMALLMMAGAYAHAQVTATVSGTVTDPSGALVQGADITVINEATQDARPTDTNKSGVFSVPNLNPSTYTVRVSAKGFSPKELTGIEVHAGDEVKLPTFVLSIGAVTDTVTVTSVAGQILSLENGERAATLTYQDVQDMALQSRDTTELLKVLPGVVQTGGTNNNGGYNALSTTTGNSAVGNGMGINGAPYKGGTALNMDGAGVLDVGDDFASLATINPEMTQEIQVETSAFGADTANGPNVINTTGKSGGDHYHGEGYFDVRNDVLNANDWADNHLLPIKPKGGASYYYPGGSISGPIPGTHKKVFFFGGFELPFQNQGNANSLNFTLATPEMLGGNFSMDNADNQILCPGGFYGSGGSSTVGFGAGTYGEGSWCQDITNNNGNKNYTVFPDGGTATPGAAGFVTTTYGTTTVNNSNGGYVPAKYIDSNMIDFTKNWPLWSSPYVIKTTQGIINNGGNNVHIPIVNHDNGWVARGRIDYNWNSTNQVYVSYQQSYDRQLSGGCGNAFYSCGGGVQYPGGGLYKTTYSKVLNGHYVHIFSPTLTNEALASWVWGNIPIAPNNPSANFRSTLGANIGCFYCANAKYMPTFNQFGGDPTGAPGIFQADDWEPGNYYIVQKAIPTFADNLTKVWGKHALKFGGMTSNTDNYQGNQSVTINGQLSIGGGVNGNPANYNFFAQQAGLNGCAVSVCNGYAGPMGSNNGMTDFLMGDLTGYSESNSSPLSDIAFQEIALYAQDQVKVTSKLSLEVGFRFEHVGAWYDRQGVGMAVFYPNRVLPDFYAGKYAPGFYWHAIDSGVPLSGKPNRIGFVSPRLGLAYDVFGNGKTTVRGGWGAYRYQEAANAPQAALNTAQGVQNFNASTVLGTALPGATMLLSQISQLVPFAAVCQVQCTNNGQTGYAPNDYGIPRTYSYNFTIDQRLPWNMLLDVAYVGNRTNHIQDTFGGNGDGSGPGGYDNQNKTPLNAYGYLVGTGLNSTWQPNQDPFTKRLVCNPENLAAPCNIPTSGTGSVTASTDSDFRPFGRGTACTNASNPSCTVYGTQTVTMIQHNSYQNYNALQAQIVKRAGPVTLNASLTWGKSLGTESTLDPFHIAANNSYSNLQRPIVFNSSYIYREPNFFHGNRFIGGAVNGWTISGITLWQQGTNIDPSINIQYDPATLPTGATATALGMSPTLQNATGVGASTFFGTNAGISTTRPQVTCNPKSGLVTYQLYRPCFTASQFGVSGGKSLRYVAGQAYMENDLALYKTFTVHEQNKVQFRLTATNWLNHALPQFGSNESTTEYYLYDYNTHALKVNDRCPGQAPNGNATGSCNAGNAYVTSNTYGNANGKPADLFGTQHVKSGFGPYNQRILELDVKYTF